MFALLYIMMGDAVCFADEIIVLSAGGQNCLADIYGRKTCFIPNGVNEPKIRVAEQIKAKCGLTKDSHILCLRRSVFKKSEKYFIEIFKKIDYEKN